MTQANTLSRRKFVAGAAAMGAATTFPLGRSATARASMHGRRIAIFGAGMSGLVAAQELVERGFEVDVYEPLSLFGGKARSYGVPGTAHGGRKELPAEHGFRFFPGFYQHVTETMRRIPAPGRKNGVLSALRSLDDLAGDEDGYGITYSGGPGSATESLIRLRDFRRLPDPNQLGNPAELVKAINTIFGGLATPTTFTRAIELAWFAARVGAFITACDERRKGPWDHISWWKFLRADGRSTFFKDNLVKGTTMGLVAVKPEVCSVSSAGNIMDAFVWNLMGYDRGPLTAYALRFLDGPTSEVWIDPWVAYLQSRGVRFHTGQALTGVELGGGRVTGATVVDGHGTLRRVEADWYMAAVPVDKLRPMLTTPEVLAHDPSLELMNDLHVDWMNGMQIYLKQPARAAASLVGIFDHQWTISAVLQRQLWRRDIPKEFGDGSVRDIISIDISTWDRPGSITTKKAARDCTKEEIFREVWAVLKERIARRDPAFRDSNVHSWTLDPAIKFAPGGGGVVANEETLTVQTVGTWEKRPKGPTAIPNLFLSGDWIRVTANVCSMEAANQGGRQAAQAVLAAAGGDPSSVFIKNEIATPPDIRKLKAEDKKRFDRGLPNILDAAVRGPSLQLPRVFEGADADANIRAAAARFG